MLVLLRSGFCAGLLMSTALSSYPSLAETCGFQHVFSRADEGGTKQVKVYAASPIAGLQGIRPMLFISDLKVNTDGTKISYNEHDPRGTRCASDPGFAACAINNIRNAYRNHNRPVSDFEAIRDSNYANLNQVWSVLSSQIIEKNSATGKPCITADGYLISMTADVAVDGGFNKVGDCDQSKWIDALTAPAIVLPRGNPSTEFMQRGARKRSVVVAVSRSPNNRVVSGIVGDVGPADELGEANVAMNRALNGLPETETPKHRDDAKQRFQAGRSAILIFPGAGMILQRPITAERIADRGADALERFGGADKLVDCIRSEIDPSF
jgi:hypothetical protein